MRRSTDGWKRSDLDRLYSGFGFTVRHGAKHDVVAHPDFPRLRTTLPRHRQIARGYVLFAVELIDELKKLSEEGGTSMNDLRARASQLAKRNYSVRIQRDETTEGQPIFLVQSPELPGCLAQGRTLQEALDDLADARVEYIYSLLEDGLPVPEPQARATITGSPGSVLAVCGQYDLRSEGRSGHQMANAVGRPVILAEVVPQT